MSGIRDVHPLLMGRSRLFGVLVGVCLLTGCLLPQDKSPPPQAYVFEIGAFTPRPAARPSGKTALITVPKAAPGFDTNRIAYTKEPLKLDYYNNSIWSDTPSKMLVPILVKAFEDTGAFKAVMAPPASALADIRIDVDVIRLQHEFMTKPSQVRMTARIKVLAMKSGHVLETQVFEAVEPAPSEDAYGAARAANAAVQKLLGDMVPFVLRNVS